MCDASFQDFAIEQGSVLKHNWIQAMTLTDNRKIPPDL
jgi:hypothetical protein